MSREQPGKEHLYRDAVRATWLGLAINLLLGCAKLVGGLVGRFIRPHLRRGQFTGRRVHVGGRADCFPGRTEAGRRRASLRPHPGRGHRRLERRGAGDGVCPACRLERLWGSSAEPHGVPPIWTLAIAGANVAIKEGLYQYKIRLGRRAGSLAVIANAWDHRADAFSAWRFWWGSRSFALVEQGSWPLTSWRPSSSWP